MAKALFHKHQRVYVAPVGTWAIVEQVKPHWVKDVEEPVRIYYDCGLGRDFTTHELSAEQVDTVETGQWRVLRARNKWQSMEECSLHPFPGTFPVIVTDPKDWGGWRVPAAEYDRDPNRIEAQARLLVHSPGLMEVAEQLVQLASEQGELPDSVAQIARRASDLLRDINTKPADKEPLTLSKTA
jgi:hypothetical protein|tara:strand:- start:22308 stop:22859 length:552 start_codon:yes stop_codon:yes gene_type:complete